MPAPEKKARNKKMAALKQQGLSYRQIARRFRLKSVNGVYVIIQRELDKIPVW